MRIDKSKMELLELARQLKQEQLFVSAEKSQIHGLYEEAKKLGIDENNWQKNVQLNFNKLVTT